ncbi:MAG: helix-turn-helix domain-containing protein [Pseudomonadota bacterium]
MDSALESREAAAQDSDDNWYGADTATFGDRVAGAREALGIGQPELARRLGVKVKTLRDWENDLSEPRANKLQMLAGILGVSLMWLLNGEGDGVDPPPEGTEAPEHIRDLLLELRALQADMDRSADRLARIEKRLRQVLTDVGDAG